MKQMERAGNLFYVLVISTLILQSCSIVRQIAGADIDSGQFLWDRRAKAAEHRFNSARVLSDRLNRQPSADNSDITVMLSPEAIDKVLKQYENSTGWIDESTSYTIRMVKAVLYMGSADAQMLIDARNSKYDVDVELQMNCMLSLIPKDSKIYISLEPYDISPYVKPGGIVSSVADDIVSDMIKVNLAGLGKQFPDLQLPLDFTNTFLIDKSETIVRDKLNLSINFPKRTIDYNFKLKEVLVFDTGVFISMALDKMEVSK